jgi:hypothetical protein
MILQILLFFGFFLFFFCLSWICLVKKEIIKKNLYLLLPIACITFWALYWLYSVSFILDGYFDFEIFYDSGTQVLKDPKKLYDNKYYRYLPSFALLIACSISLCPLFFARYIFYIINYVCAILLVLEFNKILILMKVKKKIQRFFFLIAISNGNLILYLFVVNQTKFLLGLMLFFILRKELQLRNEEKEKDLKYYLTTYGIFVFAIGIAPYFLFLLLIYLFHDIYWKDFFNIQNIKKYGIVIIMFLIQNILFIIYPSLINGFSFN